jgi:hypothetical protein
MVFAEDVAAFVFRHRIQDSTLNTIHWCVTCIVPIFFLFYVWQGWAARQEQSLRVTLYQMFGM